MNTSLTRSIGYWTLLALSLASAGVGGWLIAGQIGTMTATLLAGTATGVEVYVGQSLVVVGAALLGAGVLGILLAVALTAVRAMIPVAAPAVAEAIDGAAEDAVAAEPPRIEDEALSAEGDALPAVDAGAQASAGEGERGDEDQNGSSGSIATATKISVR